MFSSRLLLNLSLLTLLAILISIALISNNEEAPVSAFTQLKHDDITAIDIKYNNIITEIRKTESKWHITQPISIEADKFRLQAILNILSVKDSIHYKIGANDYKKYSLDPPKAVLKLNQQELLFGSTSPVNNKRYVLTNNQLFLIEDTFYALFTSGFNNLMRRQLFPKNLKIQKISFGKTRVYQNKQGSWQADNSSTSADYLKQFIENWLHIQAYSVNRATAPYKGTKVVIQTSNNQTIERIIQKTDVNTVVINPELGLSYQFDITAYDSLTNLNFYSTDKPADKQ